ncbi:hypothetical protein MTR_2g028040 [Medicago truncatula]|uniref:Uncharacterized protein n=1 Tax=Medicago truncatula TaxID=3880 RepID=G7ISQ4_MEDTR|nr:hypothetical protein MTR_2g028040 [Medicago truncatula]
MHLKFKEELKELLGEGYYGKGGLIKVFIEKKYIGGVEKIQKLHDDKKLEKLLDCCERIDGIEGGGDCGCEACGDIKFVPCETCYGSCKIYYEGDYEEDDNCEVCGIRKIQKLHDDKKLEKLLDYCEWIDGIEGGDGGCEACGDIKFVPCETCYGSCKIYYEGDYVPKKLHDDKKLEKLLDYCEWIDGIEGGDGGCEACGDIKFVPCETCYGSCKIYYEGDYEEDDNCEKLHDDKKLEKLLDYCEWIDGIEGCDVGCETYGDIKFVPCETCYGSCKIYYEGDYEEDDNCEIRKIQKLHDDKKLEKLLDCCEMIDGIERGDGGCEACGDIKFVPCETCYGSCKIYDEGDYEEDDNCEVCG